MIVAEAYPRYRLAAMSSLTVQGAWPRTAICKTYRP